MGRPFRDLTKEPPFGRLAAIEFVGCRNKNAYWRCSCECGGTIEAAASNLVRGFIQSCGCLRSEIAATRNFRHGLSRTATHKAWDAMIQRCTNPACASFWGYGAIGITVCDRWLESFDNFFADMGLSPPGHELDRIDNDGNYEPGNCRWATKTQNMRNRSNTRRYEHKGNLVTLGEVSEETGVPYHILAGRMRRRWSIERAVEEPVKEIA